MSEDAKKSHRAVWIIAIAGVLLIYALSIGPAFYLLDRHIVEDSNWYEMIYTPLFKTTEILHVTSLLDNYLALWRETPQFETPYRVHGGVI